MKISAAQYSMMYGPTVGDKVKTTQHTAKKQSSAAAKLSVTAWARQLTICPQTASWISF